MVRNPLPSPGNYLSWFKRGRKTVGKPEIWAESTELNFCSVQIDHQAAVNTSLVIRIGFWAQEHLQIWLGSQGKLGEEESLEEELQRQIQSISATGMRSGIAFKQLKREFWVHIRVQFDSHCRQVVLSKPLGRILKSVLSSGWIFQQQFFWFWFLTSRIFVRAPN